MGHFGTANFYDITSAISHNLTIAMLPDTYYILPNPYIYLLNKLTEDELVIFLQEAIKPMAEHL